MSRQVQGYVYLALAMLTVGSTVIASKLIASGLPPFSATALRFAIAFPVLLVLMRATGARLPKLSRQDRFTLFIQAGAGSVGYTTLLISGLSLTSAADAGVIIGTLPVVSAAISILLLRERPQPALLLAVALATAGVLSIAFTPDAAGGSLSGNALIFVAVVCEGLFILLNKRLKTEVAPLALSTLMAGIGFIVAAIPAVFEAPFPDGISASAVAAVVYYALVPTVGGFLLWYAGAERVSGTEAALFTALAPVSAVMLAFIILGEPVGLSQFAGIACVLAAVLGLAFAGSRSVKLAGGR
ncbi:DMT family transporter [Rhizobium laguerreae]|uniref:DMT family transporter n=1 Tax=Rhizobium laguerreae TaxID=1076926 RepID=UPI001A8D5FA2|nr:DMT family transporter [Rhizobium laguerreae]MBN9981836.1 DMT family transporter [Rhizobium laguerreae]MBY3069143.1 DMT family transporter [Rhizobium laguerreae]MBY3089377.1 DMT family transporter [Rhizobium laguerreae]MBY3098809.1 DMT family transporter [Rhizobium laguerreae]MBY3105860.1 DMT family transporter [Rhizobium laguerreae]